MPMRSAIAATWWTAITKAAGLPLTLGVSAALTRMLTPSQVGDYFLALSIVTFLGAFGHWGQPQVLIRSLASRPRRSSLLASMIVAASWSLVVMLTFTALVSTSLLPSIVSDSVFPTLGILVGAAGFMRSLHAVASDGLLGAYDHKWSGLTSFVLPPVLQLIALFFFVRIGQTVTVGYALSAWMLGVTVALMFAMGRYMHRGTLERDSFFPQSREQWEHSVRLGFPLWLTGLLALLTAEAGTWIVAAVAPQEQVALFAISVKAAALTVLPFNILGMSLGPYVARLHARGDMQRLKELLQGSAALALMIVGVSAMVLGVFGVPIIQLLFGPFYGSAIGALRWLLAAQCFNAAVGMCGMLLIMTGHGSLVLRGSVAGGLVMVVFGFGAATVWGASGMAAAAGAGLVVQNVITWHMARRRLGIWTHVSPRALFRLGRSLVEKPS